MKENKNSNENVKVNINDDILTIWEFLTKPFTITKQKLNKLNDIKISGVLAIIISAIATIITLIKTVIITIRETSYWSGETEWVLENIKEINFFKEIGGSFLTYLAIIVAIAGIYYIGGLIIKKDSKFPRLLGISALAVIPAIVCALLLAPILSIIYLPLGIGITIIGIVYTILVIYEIMNNELSLKGNLKLYFNWICISILLMVVCYISVNALVETISKDINNIFSLIA